MITYKIEAFIVLFFTVCLLNANYFIVAKADPNNWRRYRVHGVQLARMCVNEDSRSIRRKPAGTEGSMTTDHRWIAQVVYVNRKAKRSFRGWLDVMQFLSPHVGRVKEPKRHHHEWTSGLLANGNGPPRLWIDCRNVEEGSDCDGDWRVHGEYWVDFRERVVDYWLETDFQYIQEKTGYIPRKWGNKSDVIRFLKKYPNSLCVLPVGDRNFFLARHGQGCELGDAATVAARKGKKVL